MAHTAATRLTLRRRSPVADKPDEATTAAVGRQRPATSPETFIAEAGQRGRLLGLDVGTKTIGLALSDVGRMIATGHSTIRRTKFKDDARDLLDLAGSLDVTGLVVGLPLNLDGTRGPRVQSTEAFCRNLGALTELPMLLWDERLTTAAAERMLIEADMSRRRRADVIDKLAATLILQSALDRLRSLA